jgi:hypothetical protein
LSGTEVGAVEDLLQTEDLHALLPGVFDEGDVLVEHRLLDLGDGLALVIERVRALNQTGADDLGHLRIPTVRG